MTGGEPRRAERPRPASPPPAAACSAGPRCPPRRRWPAALAGPADRDRRRLRRRRRHRPRRPQLWPGAGKKRIGGTVVITNRPGAGGELALASVVRAKPDGHTLGTTNYPSLITIPIERQAQFKLDDFAPLGNLVKDPSAITVHAASPYARPEGPAGRGAGEAGPAHLCLARASAPTTICNWCCCRRRPACRMTHVVFQGDPQLRTAMLGKQVDLHGAQPRRRHGGAGRASASCRRAARCAAASARTCRR